MASLDSDQCTQSASSPFVLAFFKAGAVHLALGLSILALVARSSPPPPQVPGSNLILVLGASPAPPAFWAPRALVPPIRQRKTLPHIADQAPHLPAPEPVPVAAGAAAASGAELHDLAGDHGPVPVYSPVPEIPNDLRVDRSARVVLIEFAVATDSSFRAELLSSSGNPKLDAEALSVVRSWRFAPAKRQGHPVSERIRLRISFRVV